MTKSNIFGHDIFRSKALTFEPNMNIATPSSYTLGPGDEIILDISGLSQKTSKYKIAPDGTIVIDKIGPVSVSGMTVDKAQSIVRRKLGPHYQGSDIKLTVGQTRAIVINILGEVATPGTYSISAFASVFNAIYLAGGVTDIGTLRNIKVFRNGKTITTVDVYDFILNGKLTGNIMLRDIQKDFSANWTPYLLLIFTSTMLAVWTTCVHSAFLATWMYMLKKMLLTDCTRLCHTALSSIFTLGFHT